MTSLLNRVWRSSQTTTTPRESPQTTPQSSGFTPINAKPNGSTAAQEEQEEESLFVSPTTPPVYKGNYIRPLEPGTAPAIRTTTKKLPMPTKKSKAPVAPRAKTVPKASTQPATRKAATPGTQADSRDQLALGPSSRVNLPSASRSPATAGAPAAQQSPSVSGLREPIVRSEEMITLAMDNLSTAMGRETSSMTTSDGQQSEAPDPDDNNARMDSDEEEWEEMPEGEFEIEDIQSHKFVQRKILLLVKWKGYDKPEDNTWEPESNLKETAAVVLRNYYDRIGGRPEIKANVSRPRKTISRKTTPPAQHTAMQESPEPYQPASPSFETPDPWVPLAPEKGNWEELIVRVDGLFKIEEHVLVHLVWAVEDEFGRRYRTRQEYCDVRLAAPNALLKYYESSVDFEGSENRGIPDSAKSPPPKKSGNAPQANMVDESSSKKRKQPDTGSSTTLPSRQKKTR